MRVSVFAPARAMGDLAPLIEAWRKRHVVRLEAAEAVPSPEEIREAAGDADAMLVVGDRRRAPRTVLPGPVVIDATGRAVVAAWLPDVGAVPLRRFAATAAAMHLRRGGTASVAVLGQWHPDYENVADRVERVLGEGESAASVFRWTSDRMVREDMLEGIGCGLAAAIYVGHGRPVGWVGYRGTRAHHLSEVRGAPMGVLLSLCCLTASRRRTALSFCESAALSGVMSAAFGCVDKSLHVDNTRWALRFAEAIAGGIDTLAELVVGALPMSERALASYRILGDPLAPLRGTVDSVATARAFDARLAELAVCPA
jgi:hypothetical protein